MNFFQQKTTWTNAQLALVKIAIAAIYVVVGAYFHDFVNEYRWIFLTVFSITAVWTMILWLAKEKAENK